MTLTPVGRKDQLCRAVTGSMYVGIDTGGTNVDAVLVDDSVVAASKVPGDESDPVEALLDSD